ncbi:hypothetical protein KSF_064080 [Reticulibacter mediterranei]|uniref:Uncharacterized protein n=1 Tax=Reticulibacter mediterranei TaxID=2778369 RepID=A0A8J3ISZ1_9CHLR|nr:hypothetical protein KSF_064080 [Reticulibacter mediterranei]
MVVSMRGIMEDGERAASLLRAGMEVTLKRSQGLSREVIMAVVVDAMVRGLGAEMCAPLFYYYWQNSRRMGIT